MDSHESSKRKLRQSKKGPYSPTVWTIANPFRNFSLPENYLHDIIDTGGIYGECRSGFFSDFYTHTLQWVFQFISHGN